MPPPSPGQTWSAASRETEGRTCGFCHSLRMKLCSGESACPVSSLGQHGLRDTTWSRVTMSFPLSGAGPLGTGLGFLHGRVTGDLPGRGFGGVTSMSPRNWGPHTPAPYGSTFRDWPAVPCWWPIGPAQTLIPFFLHPALRLGSDTSVPRRTGGSDPL
jgi:hypothetical protein